MPRPRRIDWQLQMAVFRDFRRLQRVLPVANRHGIARVTVSTILRDLEEQGFARTRRVELPEDLLKAAQQRHLHEVWQQLRLAAEIQEPSLTRLAPPTAAELRLPDPATSAKSLPPSLKWHLTGHVAREHLDAVTGVSARDRRERSALLNSIAEQLCTRSGFSVLIEPIDSANDATGYLSALVDALYDEWCGVSPALSEHPPAGWRSDGRWLQMAPGWRVAYGAPSRHPALIEGFVAFQRMEGPALQTEAQRLDRLRSDLRYVHEVLQGSMAAVSEGDVQASICPMCPYPECQSDAPWPKGTERRKQIRS